MWFFTQIFFESTVLQSISSFLAIFVCIWMSAPEHCKSLVFFHFSRFLPCPVLSPFISPQSEFADFLHPEEAKHMQHIVIQETLNDIDKDKDGFVSLEEYIGDMYHPNPGEAVPEWVENEKEQFKEYRFGHN